MKKICMLVSVLVLTISLATGCGCRNSRPAPTTMPTTLPTEAIVPTTVPTVPTTMETVPPTIEDGNGPLPTEDPAVTENTSGERGRSGITGSITG